MRLRYLPVALFLAVQVSALVTGGVVRAQNEAPEPVADPNAGSSQAAPATKPETGQPGSSAPGPTQPSPTAAALAQVPADTVVTLIRAKLADRSRYQDANADDLTALETFYRVRANPVWMTEMGLTARGQAALFEIGKADDWGLDAKAFDLPNAGALPTNSEAQAETEIKLASALLKYARHARGGRLTPLEVSSRFDQKPSLRDPNLVLSEIAASNTPDLYLQSLHPKYEQFARLREALLNMRKELRESTPSPAGEAAADTKETADSKKTAGEKPAGERSSKGKNAKPSEKDLKRLVLNLERWRWMPEDLGPTYIFSNTPEFMLYVVKDGKRIYSDKILVGTSAYPTPIMSDEMETIVFNPDWIAPPTVLVENLWPHLRKRNFSILSKHKLNVSYQGRSIDPRRIDWNRVNIRSYTFIQKAGPGNNLGKAKFLYPNEHTVYMHDTLAVRKKYFSKSVRAIGHECIRMERPDKFAEVLLAESNGWPVSKVKELWDKGVDAEAQFDNKIPVHMVYFTAVVDDGGKLSTFGDLYGFDRKLAAALLGSADGFPAPPPESKGPVEARAPYSQRTAASGIAGAMQNFFSD
jgi:murein L,D-transpeptidase YcbB/YkuD